MYRSAFIVILFLFTTPIQGISQTIINGDLEAGVSVCQIDMTNDDFTALVPDVTALGELNMPDLLTFGCEYGFPRSGDNFVLLQANQGLTDALALRLDEPIKTNLSYNLSFYARKPENLENNSMRLAIGVNITPYSNGELVRTIDKLNNTWTKYSVIFKPPIESYYIMVLIESGPYAEILVDHFQLECPKIDLGKDSLFCLFTDQILEIDTYFENILWSNGSIENHILVTEPGTYSVTAEFGNCIVSDEIKLEESENNCTCNIYVPNLFTPNNDAINDHWEVLANCPFRQYSLEIYNRWGSKIFSSNNALESWNGYYGNQIVQSGLYSYLLKYQTEYGEPKIQYGTIMVMR